MTDIYDVSKMRTSCTFTLNDNVESPQMGVFKLATRDLIKIPSGLGEFDVLVGINLLREGLDIPECGLVASAAARAFASNVA